MNKEKLAKQASRILRALPHFRGKHRIGKCIEGVLIGSGGWADPVCHVRLKDGREVQLDVRSETHSQAFWCGIYDSELIRKFTGLFEAGWIALDVGANIGYYAIGFGRALKATGGRVLCFEPVESTFRCLQNGIARNRLERVVSAFNFGLGEKEETLRIATSEEGCSGNAVIASDALVEKRGFRSLGEILIRPLDQVAAEEGLDRCDFLKVDIEGAEIYFMRGARAFIEKTQPIVYGEFNSYFMREAGLSFGEAWDFFSGLGYEIFVQERARRKRLTNFRRVEKFEEGLSDLLFLPPHLSAEKKRSWAE